MSRQNLEIVLRATRAAAELPKPDFATINELFDSGHVLVPAQLDAHEGVVGARAYRDFMREYGSIMRVDSYAVEGAVDIGPKTVLGVVSARQAGLTSGATVEQRFWFLFTVADGKITRTEVHSDPLDAIRASGLLE